MASSYTTNKRIEKPAHNDDVDTWEVPVNSNSDILDKALGGTTSLVVTGLTGTTTLAAADYRSLILAISGVLTANVTYSIPSGVGGSWVVVNTTTGAFNVVLASAGGGTSVTTVQGGTSILFCNGTNVAQAVNQSQISAAMAPVVSAATILAGMDLLAASGATFGSNVTVTGNETVTGTLGLGGLLTLNTGANFAALSAGAALVLDGSKNAVAIAPGTSGNVLTSTGTGWASSVVPILPRYGTQCIKNPAVAGTITVQAHGLGAIPDEVSFYLECLVIDAGYTVGQRLYFQSGAQDPLSQGVTIMADATNTSIAIGGGGLFYVQNGSTAALSSLTAASWKVVVTPQINS